MSLTHRYQLSELVDGLYFRENLGYNGFRVQTKNPWGCRNWRILPWVGRQLHKTVEMVKADLTGKVAIVTGASRGIGRAISVALAKSGCRMVLAARTKSCLEKAAGEIKRLGVDAICIKTDVSQESEVRGLVKKALGKFGRIDILVNNAGVGYAVPIIKTEEEDWDRMMEVNAKGAFFCCREVLRRMIHLKTRGIIVNIASLSGKKGYLHQAVYCASKYALLGFSKVLAMEGKEFGIRVHCICPGGVATDFIKRMRPDIETSTLIKPEDIAEVVLFLISRRPDIVIDEIAIRRFAADVL